MMSINKNNDVIWTQHSLGSRYVRTSLGVILFIVIFMLSASCTARLDVKTKSGEERLVIYGSVTSEESRQKITITRSAPYFSDGSPVGVSDAKVYVLWYGGRIDFDCYYPEDGIYLSNEWIGAKPGQRYILHVEVDSDGDGETELYTASAWTPYPVEMDTIQLAPSETFKNKVEVLLWATLPETEECYFNFRVSRSVNEELNAILEDFRMYDGKYLAARRVENFPCYYISDNKESEIMEYGDEIFLTIDVMPRDYGEFLANAQAEVSGSVPIFSGPPANLEGNFILEKGKAKNMPLGYFSAVATSRMSTYYLP